METPLSRFLKLLRSLDNKVTTTKGDSLDDALTKVASNALLNEQSTSA